MKPSYNVPEGDTRRDLHRTTVHLQGFGGARFEWFKKALFDVQDEAGQDAISIVIHRPAEVQ